jgi:hypothetical protein
MGSRERPVRDCDSTLPTGKDILDRSIMRLLEVAMGRFLVVLLVGMCAACGSRLETGYKPRKLSASEAERRAYYADPFSPEARALDSRGREMGGAAPRR